MIDASGLAKVFIDLIVRHHGPLDSIVSDRDSVFTSKFWSPVTLPSSTAVATYASPAKLSIPVPDYLQNKLCMADPFPPDI